MTQKAIFLKLKLDLDILEGPPECTICSCGQDIEFRVYLADGATEIGKISKQWAGFFNEAFTDYDIFGINFPKDLEVTKKALLLGATFLIDYNFFEKSGNGKQQRQSKTIGPKLMLLGIIIIQFIAMIVLYNVFISSGSRSSRYG